MKKSKANFKKLFILTWVGILIFSGIAVTRSQDGAFKNDQLARIHDVQLNTASKTYPDHIVSIDKVQIEYIEDLYKTGQCKITYHTTIHMAGSGVDGQGKPVKEAKFWSEILSREIIITYAQRPKWYKFANADLKKFLSQKPTPTPTAEISPE